MGFELNLAAVTRLAVCCTLPLLADADTGYGNAVNVYHTTYRAVLSPQGAQLDHKSGEIETKCVVK